MDALIENLQKTEAYTVTEIGAEGEKTNTITGYRALNTKHQEAAAIEEISTADLVSITRLATSFEGKADH